jgi:4-hydroxy-2-oxoheptanedioate aldolase
MFRTNALKAQLLQGQAAFGIVHTLAHASVAEMIGLAGFDFVLIDAEHGQGDHQAHLACLQALGATSACGLMRVESADRTVIKRALDIGVEGIMVPNVSTGAEAREIVASCRYPPAGARGYAASGVRASDYGFQSDRYMKHYASELLIAVMIEGRTGCDNAEAIAAVDGIDVIQVGANDLSYDLGIPEQFSHPDLLDALDRIERAALSHGKILGGAPLPGSGVAALVERGYRMLTVGRDASLFVKALTSVKPQAT